MKLYTTILNLLPVGTIYWSRRGFLTSEKTEFKHSFTLTWIPWLDNASVMIYHEDIDGVTDIMREFNLPLKEAQAIYNVLKWGKK